MTDNNARKKYVLSRHLDALIDRLINQDFRRRLSKNDFNDGWLKKILDPKEHEEYYDLDKSITEQDLRNEVRSLYFECLLDFLGSQDIKLVAQKYGDGGCKCSFKGRLAVLDYQPSILHGRYLSFTWITFSIDSFSDKSFRYVIIEPWIEDKIDRIAYFVIQKRRYLPMFEASKTIRKKTVEERTHVDKDGREFFEWDTYGLVQRLGEEAGRDLNYTEKDIRTNFKLTTLDS